MEEPPTTKAKFAPGGGDSSETFRVDPTQTAEEPLFRQGSPEIKGAESERLLQAEIERDRRIAHDDKHADARSLKSGVDDDGDREEHSTAETTYRKVFNRAAQCLREAFQCDGVLFVDGLIGFHGTVQPVPESEQELESEATSAHRQPGLDRNRQHTHPEGTASSERHQSQQDDDDNTDKHDRVFTSTEFQRGAHTDRPSEILALTAHPDVRPNATSLSDTTLGLEQVDEGFLQRLMDRHPNGAVWYFDGISTVVKNDAVIEQDLLEETDKLRNAFPNLRQLVFQPLTDPTSSKRLAGCFIWRQGARPVFSDVVDLPALRGFLHVIESEIARLDAAAAVKQQESFVSSVSHELRTPLHGILGTVQLLKDSKLDELQESLINTIHFCGETLHNTLTSVLSYAKINQFERRQHKFRQRNPPDAVWALPDKHGRISGPDRDFEGLYICTNVAMLCEEIVGVLEAGQSFQQPIGSKNVVVVLNVQHHDNWSFYTEPGAIRRIATNLIGNALKYTSKGSVITTLELTQAITDPNAVSNDVEDGRTLVMTVKDTGKGISKQFIQNQLFVPFTQESAGSAHGVGLGMSIVKSLVTLLSGEIHVQSEVGVGTEMKVVLPLQSCPSVVESEEFEERPHEAEFVQTVHKLRAEHLHVCIYGFPEPVRESLRYYLEIWYHCTIIESTDDAEPDIVLVDEGNEGIREQVHRTAEHYGHNAVLLNIAMTASRMGSPMEAIKGYKVWERIPRPLGPSTMGQTLSRCVGKLKKLRDANSKQTDMEDQEDLVGGGGTQQGAGEASQGGSGKVLSSESQDDPNQQDASQETIQNQTVSSMPERPRNRESRDQPASDLRVLLVDDNALNLRLLKTFLKKAGYVNVTEAENGQKAVEAVQDKSDGFDIVFMGTSISIYPSRISTNNFPDMSMPVMDGFEATRQIRKIETERGVAKEKKSIVVALTGLGSSQDKDKAFGAGVDMFVTKPVQFADLSKVLKQCEEGTLKKPASNKSS